MLLPYPALSALQELKVELREMDGGEQGTWPETTKDFQDGAEDGLTCKVPQSCLTSTWMVESVIPKPPWLTRT